MSKLNTVTLDTNALPADDLIKAGADLGIDLKLITVTYREVQGTDIAVNLNEVYETGVWGESEWDRCVWVDEPKNSTLPTTSPPTQAPLDPKDRLEIILGVVSNGGFPPPGKREALTEGQTRQLRDALIFEAHVREGRDIFVTKDRKAFFGPRNAPHSIRKALEMKFGTVIMTPDEFLSYCAMQKTPAP